MKYNVIIMLMAAGCLMACGGSTKSESKSDGTEKVASDVATVDNTDDDDVEVLDGDGESAGEMAPDFTLKSIDGSSFTLSSLRGKIVVLDFWGSWCGWCVKGMPEMKKYYAKYKGKFEIVGIDCNDTVEDWREAVEDNGLPWIHVRVPESSDLLEEYGIEGFPTKIVLDEKGRVINVVEGEDPEFYDFLDQLLS